MKRILLAICCAGILIQINGCYKSYDDSGYSGCTLVSVDNDSTALLKFAWYHMITPTRDNSGLYYQITNPASGAGPSATATVYVTYVGKLMDGTTFDSTGNADKTGWVLNTLLGGWQIGLSKICAGGHIKLLIPSALAFGCTGTHDGSVPPNAPVFYDITLVRFYN